MENLGHDFKDNGNGATLKPGNRNPDSGIGNRKPESGNRNQETGIRKPETGIRNQESTNQRKQVLQIRKNYLA